MRHRVAAKHFNRDSNQRQSLFKGLVTALIEHGQTTTTRAKAREIKRLADKLIHQAQTDSVASRRELHSFFGKRDIVNTLVERVAPLFKDRSSGFTRITAVGLRRGDNSEMVTLSLVNQPDRIGTLKSGIKHAPIKKSVKVVVKPATKVASAKGAKAEKVVSSKTTKAATKPAKKAGSKSKTKAK